MKSGDVCHTENSVVLGKTARRAGGTETGLLTHVPRSLTAAVPLRGRCRQCGVKGVWALLPAVIFHVG